MTARCTRSGPADLSTRETTLRIGVPEPGSDDELEGTRQLRQILSTEGLARIGEDGRPVPRLAEGWTTANDGLSVKIRLRPAVKFHDGSPVDAASVAEALNRMLPRYMGPAFSDVDHIASASDREIDISLRRPSPFLLEALEAQIRKPDSANVSTGPYMAGGPNASNEFQANPNYYLGRPKIDRIVVSTYPNVRSAWADMLRDKVDMLFEVGVDALDSLATAKNISVFTYVRHYQYALFFNTANGPLRSREIRRALNKAIDSEALVRDAFDGHAVPSSGPVWPQHWALRTAVPKSSYDPQGAATLLAAAHSSRDRSALRFRCLVRPPLERVALNVKRQLEAVGVDMSVQEAPLDAILQSMAKHDFDAVLLEVISGPSLFRPYEIWHSGGLGNSGANGSPALDVALDKIRYATSDDQYRAAVAGFQQAALDDPPAIFLVWPERARAVSRRFSVPAEPGFDVLPTLPMWRPVNAEKAASRN